MPCFSPQSAHRLDNGDVVFTINRGNRKHIASDLTLSCGQCLGCRIERSRQWGVRCMHESQMHTSNSFITLTYAPKHFNPSIQYRDFQLFLKRLRKRISPVLIRFYVGSEYSPINQLPHFHALIFGYDFPDKLFFKTTKSGSKLYTSKLLDEVWNKGYASVGSCTFDSACYIAQYCTNKSRVSDIREVAHHYNADTGEVTIPYYQRTDPITGEVFTVSPEANKMSNRPGIGRSWFDKYRSDVFPHDYVVVNGKKATPPRYYTRILKDSDPDAYEDILYQRYLTNQKRGGNMSPAALEGSEVNLLRRLSLFQRGLHLS
ncbi:MAG: replication initiator protein [Microvirus sp.]|nr:MAG: replication initiator protein [Microvirus sp.]